MLNTVYRLVEPRKIEAEFCNIRLSDDSVLVRPTHLSICNADQRYFQGSRPVEILSQKLPMALIHEGIGEVVYDKKGDFKPGQKVVMVPNTPYEDDDVIAENYLRSSKFRGSGYDGFMQDMVEMRRNRLVPLPVGIDDNVAAITELVSVSYHAIERFASKSHARRDSIGVWGDGNLAYISALLLKKLYPDSLVYVFGKHDYKLNDFTFIDEGIIINNIPEGIKVDHAFECVGGVGTGAAINQIIDCINPEGTISALGVSEENVPINTRMILEKGLTLYGSSRSGIKDFKNLLNLYENKPEIVEYLLRIIDKVIPVKSIEDMTAAFDSDLQKSGGKTIMLWEK